MDVEGHKVKDGAWGDYGTPWEWTQRAFPSSQTLTVAVAEVALHIASGSIRPDLPPP